MIPGLYAAGRLRVQHRPGRQGLFQRHTTGGGLVLRPSGRRARRRAREGVTESCMSPNVVDLGDVTVSRVQESYGPAAPASLLVPAFDPGVREEFGPDTIAQFVVPETDYLLLSIHTWVIRTPQKTILVDTCNGNHKQRNTPNIGMLDTDWLERLVASRDQARRGRRRGVHPPARRPRGLEHHPGRRRVGAHLPERPLLLQQNRIRVLEPVGDRPDRHGVQRLRVRRLGQAGVRPRAWPSCGRATAATSTTTCASNRTPDTLPATASAGSPDRLGPGCSPATRCTPRCRSTGPTGTAASASTPRPRRPAAGPSWKPRSSADAVLMPAHFSAPHAFKVKTRGDGFAVVDAL